MRRYDLRHLKDDFYDRMAELIDQGLKVGEVGIFIFEVGDFSHIQRSADFVRELGHDLMNSLKFNEVDWTLVVKKVDEDTRKERAEKIEAARVAAEKEAEEARIAAEAKAKEEAEAKAKEAAEKEKAEKEAAEAKAKEEAEKAKAEKEAAEAKAKEEAEAKAKEEAEKAKNASKPAEKKTPVKPTGKKSRKSKAK